MELQHPAPARRRPRAIACLVLLAASLVATASPIAAGAALRDEDPDVPAVGIRVLGAEETARGRAAGAPKPIAEPPAAPEVQLEPQQSGPAGVIAPAPSVQQAPAPAAPATSTTAPPSTVAVPTAPEAPAPALPPLPPPPPPPPPAAMPAGPGVEAEFLSGINGLRAAAGLSGLVRDGELDRMAAEWSAQMAATGQLRHSGLVRRIVDSRGVAAGENVGRSGSAGDMMSAFAASSGHYANIVQPAFTRVGIATVVAPDGTMWSTHLFAG